MAALTTLHQLLRESTHAAHEQIEGNARLKRLMANDLSAEEYREILERYYGFYLPLEAHLSEHPEWLFGEARDRFRAPRLRQDLQGLGLSEEEIDLLPVCFALPPMHDAQQAAGVLYVVEGSVLGGRFIAKHLEQFSFFTPKTSHFLAVDAPTTSNGWKKFLAAIGELRGSAETSVTSASATFTALDRWMTGDVRSSDTTAVI